MSVKVCCSTVAQGLLLQPCHMQRGTRSLSLWALFGFLVLVLVLVLVSLVLLRLVLLVLFESRGQQRGDDSRGRL